MKRRGKKRIYLLLSIVITILVFSYLFSYVSFSQVSHMILNADASSVVMFVCLSILMSLSRAWRYQILLKLSGYSPPLLNIFLVVLVGNFFSDLLPARLGTLVYVFIITSRMGVPVGIAVSSFAVAFLFDFLSLPPMVVMATIGLGHEVNLPFNTLILIGVAVAILAVFLLRILPETLNFFARLIGRLRFVSEAAKTKLVTWMEHAGVEIRRTMAAGVFFKLFVLSFLIRTIKYGAQFFFFFAVIKPLGYVLADVSVAKVFLGICAAESAASVPFAGVAGFGIYEGTWAVVFELLGFPGDVAKLSSIAVHLFVQVYGYALGTIALGILLLPAFKVKAQAPDQPQPLTSHT